jgi:hypothetical protein
MELRAVKLAHRCVREQLVVADAVGGASVGVALSGRERTGAVALI